MVAATEPQAVPVIDADQVDAVLKTLDRALALHRQRLAFVEECKALPFYHQAHVHWHCATFFEAHAPCSEYAIRLWASANNFAIEERVHDSPDIQQRFRVLSVRDGEGGLVNWHGKNEWQEPVVDGDVKPANVIVPPPEMWRPADDDDGTTRFTLLELE